MVRIAVMGIEILRLDWSGHDDLVVDGQGYADDGEVEWVEDDGSSEWNGASTVGAYVERDTTPASPDDRYAPWEEDRRRSQFGFC